MKNALCLSGQPRFYKKGYEYLYKNIIEPNRCDVFIHCWSDDVPTSNEIVKLFKPTAYIFEPQKENLAPQSYSYYKKRAGAPTDVQFSMFYSMKEAMRLKHEHEVKNEFKYVKVVKSRFDCAILDSLNLMKYSDDKIFFPDVLKFPGVLCDYFNFSSSSYMDTFLDLYSNLHSYYEQGIGLCGENMSIHHLSVNNIQTEGIQISTFLLRDEELNDRYWGKEFK